MTVVFLLFAFLTVAGAVAALALRRLVHCALALTIALAGLGMLYLLLGAEFAGLAQLLVYVGAVAILIVFAILLTGGAESGSAAAQEPGGASAMWTAGAAAAAVFLLLAWSTNSGSGRLSLSAAQAPPPATMRAIGEALMGPFVMPLEAAGLMLTAALLGAAMIALDERRKRR